MRHFKQKIDSSSECYTLTYRIRPNYHTVRLGVFSLIEKPCSKMSQILTQLMRDHQRSLLEEYFMLLAWNLFFNFRYKSICCGCSFESSHLRWFKWVPITYTFISWGDSNEHPYRPRWLSWIRRPTGDQEVASLTPAEVGNILSWRLIMKYFLRSFSPFRWFKKGSCQFLAKECAQYWLTA